jgi:SAM-dependent methyltransferase
VALLVVEGAVVGRLRRRQPRPLNLAPAGAAELERVKAAFDGRGSDKSSAVDYTAIYASILPSLPADPRILEIGIGTNFEDVDSSMGPEGVPGASLRAFRDLRPDATVFGADVDRRILFSEPGITTHWVDQLDRSSLAALRSQLGGQFDLVIDDGLHTRPANLNTFRTLFPAVRPGGWFVIEDVVGSTIPFWEQFLAREQLAGEVFDTRSERNDYDSVAVVIRAPGASAN